MRHKSHVQCCRHAEDHDGPSALKNVRKIDKVSVQSRNAFVDLRGFVRAAAVPTDTAEQNGIVGTMDAVSFWFLLFL